jgi:radical SAM-linked protein
MRLRITFTKQGALRWTGNLDLHKSWERTIRRAELPLAYSQGFHPQPKIQLASALPLGFTSQCEVLDLFLQEDVAVTEAESALRAAVPPGIEIVQVEQVDETSPPLQTQVAAAEYAVTLLDPIDTIELARRIDSVLSAESLPQERRGKKYDLRPLILTLDLLPSPARRGAGGEVEGEGQGEGIFMRLSAAPSATGRPEEVLAALEIEASDARVERTKLIY